MRGKFADLPLLVELDLFPSVDGEDLVGVDSHQDRTRVSLDGECKGGWVNVSL